MSLIQNMTSIWVASFILNVKRRNAHKSLALCWAHVRQAGKSAHEAHLERWPAGVLDVLSSFPSSHTLPGVRWAEMDIWLGTEVSNFTLLSTAGLFPSLLQNQDAAHSLL